MKKYEVNIFIFSKTGVASSSHVVRSHIVEAEDMFRCMQKVLNFYVLTLHLFSNYKVEIEECK